jgi:hypothetical protein
MIEPWRVTGKALAIYPVRLGMSRTKLLAAFTLTALLAGCGGNASKRKQQEYEVVQEGSASGVTSTIQGPGETLPPITDTNVDTTTAMTIDPNAVASATTPQPPPVAGTLPPPMTSAAPMPPPARVPIPVTAPIPKERKPPERTETTEPPPPPPTNTDTTTTAEEPPPPTNTDTATTTQAPPTQTDTVSPPTLR